MCTITQPGHKGLSACTGTLVLHNGDDHAQRRLPPRDHGRTPRGHRRNQRVRRGHGHGRDRADQGRLRQRHRASWGREIPRRRSAVRRPPPGGRMLRRDRRRPGKGRALAAQPWRSRSRSSPRCWARRVAPTCCRASFRRATTGAWWVTNAVAAIAVAVPGGLARGAAAGQPARLAAARARARARRDRREPRVPLHALTAPGLPAGRAALWLSGWTWIDFPVLLPLFFLFPDGGCRRGAGRRYSPRACSSRSRRRCGSRSSRGRCCRPRRSAQPAAVAGARRDLRAPRRRQPLAMLAAARCRHRRDAHCAPAKSRALVAARIVLVALAAIVLAVELGHEDYRHYRGEEYVGAAVICSSPSRWPSRSCATASTRSTSSSAARSSSAASRSARRARTSAP